MYPFSLFGVFLRRTLFISSAIFVRLSRKNVRLRHFFVRSGLIFVRFTRFFVRFGILCSFRKELTDMPALSE
ncbi:hypothetical protein EV282_2943 [Fictibacillus sp. BK138]|jgi:hypothetical protein|nr:hypothetical protein EV282_2943 [Fictibacillus sp. BK138]